MLKKAFYKNAKAMVAIATIASIRAPSMGVH